MPRMNTIQSWYEVVGRWWVIATCALFLSDLLWTALVYSWWRHCRKTTIIPVLIQDAYSRMCLDNVPHKHIQCWKDSYLILQKGSQEPFAPRIQTAVEIETAARLHLNQFLFTSELDIYCVLCPLCICTLLLDANGLWKRVTWST